MSEESFASWIDSIYVVKLINFKRRNGMKYGSQLIVLANKRRQQIWERSIRAQLHSILHDYIECVPGVGTEWNCPTEQGGIDVDAKQRFEERDQLAGNAR